MWTGEEITHNIWIFLEKIGTQKATEDPQFSQVTIVPLCVTIILARRNFTADDLHLAMTRLAMMTTRRCPSHTTEKKTEMDTEKAQRGLITG